MVQLLFVAPFGSDVGRDDELVLSVHGDPGITGHQVMGRFAHQGRVGIGTVVLLLCQGFRQGNIRFKLLFLCLKLFKITGQLRYGCSGGRFAVRILQGGEVLLDGLLDLFQFPLRTFLHDQPALRGIRPQERPVYGNYLSLHSRTNSLNTRFRALGLAFLKSAIVL
jgi:hypothetical protein